MKRVNISVLTAVCLFVLGCGGGGGSFVSITEIEPNDDFETAQAITLPLGGLTGSIYGDNDPGDYFSFHLNAGQRIKAILSYADADADVVTAYYTDDGVEQDDETYWVNGQVITTTYVAPSSGLYYFKVYSLELPVTSPATTYVLTIQII